MGYLAEKRKEHYQHREEHLEGKVGIDEEAGQFVVTDAWDKEGELMELSEKSKE